MKLGQLVKMLDDVAYARNAIREAKDSLKHGGSESTIQWKREHVISTKVRLDELLDKEIGDVTT